MSTEMKWTHHNLKIGDIRRNGKLYIIYIEGNDAPDVPMTIQADILDERLRSYYLNKTEFTRDDILNVYWNMYITKGYYIKIKNGDAEKFTQNPNKYYISYLEIAGDLGTFQAIYNKEK